MALFTAKRRAVDLAGRYLSRQSLIVVYELNRDEIYSLAAREIETKILEEKRQTVGKILTYWVRIRARFSPRTLSKQKWRTPNRKKRGGRVFS